MTKLSEAQMDALATATLLARRGLGLTIEAERVADRMVCDGLVKSGHLAAVEGVDGGYIPSDEMIAAHGSP